MSDMDQAIGWLQEDLKLREPFPSDRIGLLPKPYKKDSEKGTCSVCGKWHGLPALHLDYVGHGAITERLLSVDPDWTWEPLAFDDGLPKITQRGGDLELWIRLTIGNRSKIGVGSCPANQFDAAKVLIGDALRNAAMRFGVALDLWIKGEDKDNEPGERVESKRQRSGMQRTPRQTSTTNTEQARPASEPPAPAAPTSNGTQTGSIGKIRSDLLASVKGDAPKAKMIWRTVLESFGLSMDDEIPADMVGPIETAVKAVPV